MFSDLQVRSTLPTDILPLEAIISGPTISILSPDNYNDKYTAVGVGGDSDNSNYAIGPDTGTIELGDKLVDSQKSTYTPVEFGPLAVNGYYPLYTTTEGAEGAGNGTYHTHSFDGFDYYMPNGVDFYHGDYDVEVEEETPEPDSQPANPAPDVPQNPPSDPAPTPTPDPAPSPEPSPPSGGGYGGGYGY